MRDTEKIVYEYVVDLSKGFSKTEAPVKVNKIQITGTTLDGVVWGRHKSSSLLVGEPAFKLNFERLRLDGSKAYLITVERNKVQALKLINYELKKIHHLIEVIINEQLSTETPKYTSVNATL